MLSLAARVLLYTIHAAGVPSRVPFSFLAYLTAADLRGLRGALLRLTAADLRGQRLTVMD